MRTQKHPCGCVSELLREAWVSLCPKHEAEFQETHQRWAAEHKGEDVPSKPVKRGLLKGEP